MASFSEDTAPNLADHLSVLEDEELLDFWTEHQQLEDFFSQELACAGHHPKNPPAMEAACRTSQSDSDPDCERLILLELNLRSFKRGLRP